MNAWTWYQSAIEIVSQNAVLERLALVSVELAVLAGALACFVHFAKVGSPRVRALLWLLILAKPIIALVFGTPIPIVQFERSVPALTTAGTVTEGDLQAMLLARRAAARHAGPESATVYALPQPSEEMPAGGTAPAPGAAATPSADGGLTLPLGGVLVGCWLAGVLAFGFLTLRDRLRLRQLLRSAGPPPAGWGARFATLAEQMGMRSKPQLRVTTALDSPALVGFIRPVILLPAWLVSDAEGKGLDWLVRHELTHCKMHDPLGLLVRRLAEVLFFFHPAVWWAGRKWEEAMELACDRALLESESDAHHYANELYRVLETRSAWGRRPEPADLCATRTQIGRRIEALLGDPLRTPRRLTGLSVTGISVLALLAFTVGLGFVQAAPVSPAPPAGRTASAAQPAGPAVEREAAGSHTAAAAAEQPAWFPQLANTPLREKAEKQLQELRKLRIAVSARFIDEWTLPETLEQLVKPVRYIDQVPEDLFAPGRPVTYSLNAAGDAAVIFSVGPDGDDDGGRVEAREFHGGVPDADIAVRVSEAELRVDLGPAKTPAELAKDPIYRALQKLKQREGRDNALIHYITAGTLISEYPNASQEKLIRTVLRDGWSEAVKELLPYVARFEPVFDEIRKGVALDYARNIPAQGLKTPIPNYLAGQVAAKMLCIQGTYFASREEYGQASEDYLAALTMGRDYGAPGALLIGSLVSIGIQSAVLEQIQRLIGSGTLGRQDLIGLLRRLEAIEKTQGSFEDTLKAEGQTAYFALEMMEERPGEAEALFGDDLRRIGVSVADATREAERIRREHREMWDFELRYVATPYWKRDTEAYAREQERMKAEFHPMAGLFGFSFSEVDARYLTFRAKLHEAKLAAALAGYRVDQGRFPERLGELAPTFLREVPVDPFSGEAFRYRPTGDGRNYALYSVGPDGKDDGGSLVYDPSNGTFSGGDVVLR